MSSSSRIELEAKAKLNLFLEVYGRRPDGYHEIDTVMTEIDLADRVVLEAADSISLQVAGEGVPHDETNLAWRAAEALGVGARIRLEKRIPPGAGLGGGSSDAAAVLKGLDRLYELDTPRERLVRLAAGLGADVPFFLTGKAARCRGIGDRVEPLSGVSGRRFLLAMPDLHVPTGDVYRALDPGLTGKPETARVFIERYLGEAGSVRTPFFNRLQATAEGLMPRLRAVRAEVERAYGLEFTLSGSGSSYFAEIDVDAHPETGALVAGGVSVRLLTVRA